MEILIIVGVIAVVWYFATRDGDGNNSTRVDPSRHYDARRPPGHGATTTRPPGSARSITSPFAQKIQSAINSDRDIYFRYSDVKGDVTRRTIRPHRFVEFEFTHGEGRSLCVQGHCRLRNESRTFALRRMSELQIL